MQLNPTPYNTDGVSHFPATKKLLAEASDLGLRVGHEWDRLYDDACDVGIVLQSHLTGQVSRWHLVDEMVDRDGDVRGWKFAPCSESVHKLPKLEGYTLCIAND